MTDISVDHRDYNDGADVLGQAEIIGASALERRIYQRISPALAGMGYDIVRVSVLGSERPTVQIMADRLDGAPVNVEDCGQISHAVGALMDVDDPIPGAWNLEVSSPGIDRPLTRLKDWKRFVGHEAKAELEFPRDGRKRFAGKIASVGGEDIMLDLSDGGRAVLPFSGIRKGKLVLTDALIEANAVHAAAHGAKIQPQIKINPVKPGRKKAQ